MLSIRLNVALGRPRLPPSSLGPDHALDQYDLHDCSVDERAADLQCSSGALLGHQLALRRTAGGNRDIPRLIVVAETAHGDGPPNTNSQILARRQKLTSARSGSGEVRYLTELMHSEKH